MYSNERIIIDTRKYDIDEIFYRYKEKKIIFYEKTTISRKRKNKVVKEVVDALFKGIPYPPIYVSELQTGELLVLDKSDKLRFLLEFLEETTENYYFIAEEYRDIEELRYRVNSVWYAKIVLYVIDYMNPKYVHMRVGSFVEEWTPTQEQGVRNVLYRNDNLDILENLAKYKRYTRTNKLVWQYNFLYFIMMDHIVQNKFQLYQNEDWDKFQLLDKVLEDLGQVDRNIQETFFDFSERVSYKFSNKYYIKSWEGNTTEEKMKFLCFMYACENLNINGELLFEQNRIREKIISCDMSYQNITKTIRFIKENITHD